MLKWVINLLLIYFFFKFAKSLWAKPAVGEGDKKSKKKPKKKVNKEEELVLDPQCNTYIPLSDAVKGPGGHYFCGTECRDKFKNKEKEG